jgi:arylsulfatase A-like enzyme
MIAALPWLLGFAAGASAAAPKTDPRPNIVIILADDLGYGDTGTYGGWIETPHLDKLAAEGMKFTDFHSSGNVCSPTRAGLVTGRYQQRAGIPGVINADPPPTIAACKAARSPSPRG